MLYNAKKGQRYKLKCKLILIQTSLEAKLARSENFDPLLAILLEELLGRPCLQSWPPTPLLLAPQLCDSWDDCTPLIYWKV
jgi:hypothetical protein